MSNAFARGNVHVTKSLFEGNGAKVRTNLYKQFVHKYTKTVFVLASNALPAAESQGVDPDIFNKDIWHPLCTRVDFCHLSQAHGNEVVFPYSESQLAHALDLLRRYPELCNNIKVLDEEKPPADPSKFENWHKQQTKAQREAFEAALDKLA